MSGNLYRRYLALLEKTSFDTEFVGYEWGQLPHTLNIMWMPYRMMFNEFSQEIANSLNDLTNYTRRLKAWNGVISSMTDQEKLDAAHDFIDPVATVSLNLPYVIRSRFIFAAAHLCHQANRAKVERSWQNDLPLDHEIFMDAADKHGAGWRRYGPFKSRIERIGDKKYQTKTHDFRNTYNHRFSPHVVIGITQAVTRKVDQQTKQVSYALTALPALTLDLVVGLLVEQCNYSRKAFEAFQKLVREHERSISEHERRHACKDD
jgi:hypothetical protein